MVLEFKIQFSCPEETSNTTNDDGPYQAHLNRDESANYRLTSSLKLGLFGWCRNGIAWRNPEKYRFVTPGSVDRGC